ncbi:hypothetical protein M514_25493 [Trichuris suis]|uniref:DUF4371 domain-containing protein n=1 Tax=Trichuris suis TaxID=68888 RepID=A0A085MYS4_9BILA|nr:hypothetical protein M514_25493 [Trichuris suis]
MAYVRFIKQEDLVQELLFAKELLTETKGESIFEVVNDFFKEKQIPFKKILAVATDGAPSMVGRYRGFVEYLKEVLPEVLPVHCVLHRQQLVAKRLSVRLSSSLQYVIQAVNRIKANALSDRLFRQLCDENVEEFNRLLLHIEAKICCEEARGSNNAVGAPASNPSRNSQYEELAGERTAVLGGDFPPIFAPSADMFRKLRIYTLVQLTVAYLINHSSIDWLSGCLV